MTRGDRTVPSRPLGDDLDLCRCRQVFGLGLAPTAHDGPPVLLFVGRPFSDRLGIYHIMYPATQTDPCEEGFCHSLR